MYVLQHHPDYSSTTMLHELDKKGLQLAKRAYPNHHFEVISGIEAHRWVRQGQPHSTPLWVDQGRIRYARDEVVRARKRKPLTNQQFADRLNKHLPFKMFTGAK